ncbi:hypothetical protein GMMP1_430011 [Candidatus Magnetomoraceae bacterium gMMP-1]
MIRESEDLPEYVCEALTSWTEIASTDPEDKKGNPRIDLFQSGDFFVSVLESTFIKVKGKKDEKTHYFVLYFYFYYWKHCICGRSS